MNIEQLVDRFLAWPLPKSVASDPCVTDRDYPHQRVGTNLLTADEARQMIEYLLTTQPAAVPEERLRALLEGLECEEIENLMQQRPEILRAVGVEIGKAAKLGAHLYAAAPKPEGEGK
jgi:hypothetical protein